MDTNFISNIIPIAVAFTAGYFAYFTAISTKEKEIRIKKYEELGMKIFTHLEEMSFFVAILIISIDNKIKEMGNNPSLETSVLHDIYYNHEKSPNPKTARQISISLAFTDKEIKDEIDVFFAWYEKEIRKNLYISTSLINPQIKRSFSADELKTLKENLKTMTPKIKKVKNETTSKLAESYHNTLSVNNRVTIKCILFAIVLIIVCYFSLSKTEPEVKNIYEIHVSGESRL